MSRSNKRGRSVAASRWLRALACAARALRLRRRSELRRRRRPQRRPAYTADALPNLGRRRSTTLDSALAGAGRNGGRCSSSPRLDSTIRAALAAQSRPGRRARDAGPGAGAQRCRECGALSAGGSGRGRRRGRSTARHSSGPEQLPPFTYFSVGPAVSYAFDFAGGVRRTIEQQRAHDRLPAARSCMQRR